jgi:hypothetical protein
VWVWVWVYPRINPPVEPVSPIPLTRRSRQKKEVFVGSTIAQVAALT